RSMDTLADGADTVLCTVALSKPEDLTVGWHTVTFTIGTTIGTEVQLPGLGKPEDLADYFLLGVLDPANTIVESDSDPLNEDNTAVLVGAYKNSSDVVYFQGGQAADCLTLTYSSTSSTFTTSPLTFRVVPMLTHS